MTMIVSWIFRRVVSYEQNDVSELYTTLMMEEVCTSETLSTPTRLHAAISQKAVIFIFSAMRM
jgi:N-acetylmuramic acid 6-phosphate (MurNAc-6-P) etherase